MLREGMNEKGTEKSKQDGTYAPDASRDLIFGLPNGIFGPISSPARRAYARLLLRVHRDFLEQSGGLTQLSQTQVVEVISDLMSKGEEFDKDDEFAPSSHNAQLSVRPANVYRRLVDAGWFHELVVGFETYVTMPRSVAQLLSSLDRIEKGEAVNFRGSIQLVQTILDRLAEDPFESALLLEQASSSTESFSQSMRILLDDIRSNEKEIMKSTSVEDLVSLFFDRFVASLVTDYKALKSKYNPIRIADAVLSRTSIIMSDREMMEEIARGYVKFGMCEDEVQAVTLVENHLVTIDRVFAQVRITIAEIDQARGRVEDRFIRAVRFADAARGGGIDLMSEALEGLGRVATLPDMVFVESDISLSSSPFGAATMRLPSSPRPRIGRVRVAAQRHDKVLSEAVRTRNEMARALFVETDDLEAFIESVLGDDERVRLVGDGSKGLREMVLLSKARLVATFEEGALASSYGFVADGGLEDGFWSTFASGEIVRRTPSSPDPVVISRLESPEKKSVRAGIKRSNVR